MFVNEFKSVKPVSPPDDKSIVAWVDSMPEAPNDSRNANNFATSALGLSTVLHGPVLITGAPKNGRMVDMPDVPEEWIARFNSALCQMR